VDPVEPPEDGYRAKLARLIADAHAAHAELLERVPAGVRASLPVDATGVTQAIDVLAGALGIGAEIAARRDRLNRANPAVLHGRVFGRTEQLSPETVVAAFADGARVRRALLEQIAEAIGDADLIAALEELLDGHPPPDPGGAEGDDIERLRDAYAAQERAVLLCAERLDEHG
jgi:hypothetical protein